MRDRVDPTSGQVFQGNATRDRILFLDCAPSMFKVRDLELSLGFGVGPWFNVYRL